MKISSIVSVQNRYSSLQAINRLRARIKTTVLNECTNSRWIALYTTQVNMTIQILLPLFMYIRPARSTPLTSNTGVCVTLSMGRGANSGSKGLLLLHLLHLMQADTTFLTVLLPFGIQNSSLIIPKRIDTPACQLFKWKLRIILSVIKWFEGITIGQMKSASSFANNSLVFNFSNPSLCLTIRIV